jgi:hypothetical protein
VIAVNRGQIVAALTDLGLAVAEEVFGDRLAAAAGFFVTHCSQRPTDVPPSDRRRTLGS